MLTIDLTDVAHIEKTAEELFAALEAKMAALEKKLESTEQPKANESSDVSVSTEVNINLPSQL